MALTRVSGNLLTSTAVTAGIYGGSGNTVSLTVDAQGRVTAAANVVSSGGGITYTTVKTANYTAVADDGVQTNTTAGAFTVTLPATPANGDQVFVVDSFNTWGTNNLTIGRNGSTIEGVAQDLVCDITGVSVQCVYNGTTWDIFTQVGGAGGNASQWTTSGSQVYFTGSIGVGTSAINSWYVDNKAIDMPAGSVFSYSTTSQFIGQNTFVNASGTQVAKATGASSVYAQSAGIHQFASAPSVSANSTQTFTTVLEFGKGKTLALESATSVSGTGISFPSTQSASSDANTLDDYEEGTFTPTYVAGYGSFTSITYGLQSGKYTKIGNMVSINIYIYTSAVTVGTATTAFTMPGLPFTASADSACSLAKLFSWNFGAVTKPINASIGGSTTIIYFFNGAYDDTFSSGNYVFGFQGGTADRHFINLTSTYFV